MSINRRNFLALIPSLSAIPLIGKDIIQEKDKVIIWQPEIIKVKRLDELDNLPMFDWKKCKVQLAYEGQMIGEGFLTEMSMYNDDLELQNSDPFGPKEVIRGLKNIEISAQLYNFHLDYKF